MSENSRRGKKIASKACDFCIARRTQCTFATEDPAACQKCRDSGVECTFLQKRKRRGPPNRRLQDYLKRSGSDCSSFPSTETAPSASSKQDVHSTVSAPSPGLLPPLPISTVTLEHFVPEALFFEILDDFVERVYPVVPLIHVPSFIGSLKSRQYAHDPAFLRLCLALCAVTIASMPRNLSMYSRGVYSSVTEMVDRACQLLVLSRLATNPNWQNAPSLDSTITTVVIALATLYSGGYRAGWCRASAGWTYASEAANCLCSLGLYQARAFDKLDFVEREMGKRAFWLLFFVQVHDRLSSVIPHTGLSYDPLHADWKFLMPLEVDDEELATMNAMGSPGSGESLSSAGKRQAKARPLISGFISLIQVFWSASEVLKPAFQGTPQEYDLSSGSRSVLPRLQETRFTGVTKTQQIKLDALFFIMKELQTWSENLPAELKIVSRTSLANIIQQDTSRGYGRQSRLRESQFEIMKANIHVASLHIQSTMLELCLSSFQISSSNAQGHSPATAQRSSSVAGTSIAESSITSHPTGYTDTNMIDLSVHTMLWEIRVNLAKDLLHVLNSFSTATLEANGNSMITKIREIAGTLLESEDGNSGDENLVAMKEQNKQYVARFVEILARLDQGPSCVDGLGE